MKHLNHHITNIIIPLIPAIMFLGLMTFHWQISIDEFHPALSDEVFVWHQAASFAQVGLDSGYYTRDEVIPRLEASHYYAWGLGRPIVLGTIAYLVGWELYTPVILNLVVLSLAGLLFTFLVPLNRWQKLALAILLLVYPAILIYMPLAMIEILQLSFGWLWATLFLRWQTQSHHFYFIMLLALTLTLSLFQLSWSFLLLPLLYVFFRRTHNRRLSLLFSSLLCAPGIVLSFAFQNLTAAPYAGGVSQLIALLYTDVPQFFVALSNQIVVNLSLVLRGEPLFIVQRMVMLGLIGWAILGIAGMFTRYDDTTTSEATSATTSEATSATTSEATSATTSEATSATTSPDYYRIVLLVLGITFIATIILFQFIGQEFRPFSLVIFIAMILLIAWHKLWFISIVLLLYVVILPVTSDRIGNLRIREDFPTDYAQIEQIYDRSQLAYQDNAPSPWCNTVFTTIRFLTNSTHLLAIPAGMGISFTTGEETIKEVLPIKSQYVLVDEEMHTLLSSLYPSYADAMIEIGRDELTSYSIENNTLILLNQTSACEISQN